MRMSLQITLTAVAALSLAACGTTGPAANKLLTLDGNPPLVIAHRGASGYLPEETLAAYARANDCTGSAESQRLGRNIVRSKPHYQRHG